VWSVGLTSSMLMRRGFWAGGVWRPSPQRRTRRRRRRLPRGSRQPRDPSSMKTRRTRRRSSGRQRHGRRRRGRSRRSCSSPSRYPSGFCEAYPPHSVICIFSNLRLQPLHYCVYRRYPRQLLQQPAEQYRHLLAEEGEEPRNRRGPPHGPGREPKRRDPASTSAATSTSCLSSVLSLCV
jgi:hypothetical protein